MEFEVVTLSRSLDLSKNYQPVQVGALKVGLQAIDQDVAEIEIQGPEGITQLAIPLATAAISQGYTFINRDVGIAFPKKKKRGLFRRGDKVPPDGLMEVVLDIRWGDQALSVAEPTKNHTYDFILARQYEIVNDRPMVYDTQDKLQFGEMRLKMAERVEEGSRNYKRPRYAEFLVKFGDEEEESWQIKLNGKYDRKEGYAVRVSSYDFYNGWYQAYGISVVKGRPKEELDETEEEIAEGLDLEAHVGLSQTRLDEARDNPHEEIFKEGESKNIGEVGIKVLAMKLGAVKVMFLSPKVKTTVLVQGKEFDFGKWDVKLIGIHGDKAIIRVTEDDD